MAKPDLKNRLAVCSWSLQPSSPSDLIEKLSLTGINRLQLALAPFRENASTWSGFADLARSAGVTTASGMLTTVGEDYSTLESIRRTGGVAPDATWEANWRNLQADAECAQRLGLNLVSFHAGFIPESPSDSLYATLVDRVGRIADLFDGRGIVLSLETGQETADSLIAFLERLNRPKMGVNFDPANMILYDKDDPIAALGRLLPWVRQVHIKDARRTRTPGTWGEEVVVGQGEVDWPAFFSTLEKGGYQGVLAIEREAGNQRAQDVRAARQYLESIL